MIYTIIIFLIYEINCIGRRSASILDYVKINFLDNFRKDIIEMINVLFLLKSYVII